MGKDHIENTVVVLDDVDHVLTVPSRYIGSVSPIERDEYVFDGGSLSVERLEVVPAFITLLREVVSNSVDEHIRTGGEFANKIDVSWKDGYFAVRDNGRGLSHEDAVDKDGNSVGEPQSVVAFTRTKAGANFTEDTASIGQNGEGVSLVNIFSEHFLVETANGKKKTAIECRGNMSEVGHRITGSRQRFTRIRWRPDYARLNVDESSVMGTYDGYIHKILLDMSVCYPGIRFTWNRKAIKAKSFRAYASMYGEDHCAFVHENVDVAVYPAYEFGHVSWVNGIYTRRGGLHVEYVTHFLVKALRETLAGRYKDIKPADIKNKLFLVVSVRNMTAPRFDSQTKEELINNSDDFEAELFEDVDFEAMARSVKRSGKTIVDNITEAFRIKAELKRRKDVEKKEKRLRAKSIPKLVETYERDRSRCRLYIAEGKSALMNFLTCRDRFHAAYPLKGKFVNCVGTSRDKLIKNAEVKDLLAATGLKLSSRSLDGMRYGDVVIFTDADYDGDSICCLLINFFYRFWPGLVREGRLHRAVTPLISATNVETGESRYFFSMDDWRETEAAGGWRLDNYNKGLGSLTPEEYAFSLGNLVTVTEDNAAADSLAMAFGRNSDARKEWMMG